jgi:UDP-N-acetylmuramate: L-alanyl-gamma-D-glutamyl-meso-diaminopimelate ligase
MPLPGEHNRCNAAAVAIYAAELGVPREQIQHGFATFTGVKRRMEVRGEAAGVTVLDDFAHHPTAIAETIRAIPQKYTRRTLWALFEIVNRLVPNLHDNDVVAVFSNGKFDGIHDKLLTRLRLGDTRLR